MSRVIVWERADGTISYGVAVPGLEARMIEQYEKSQAGYGARCLGARDSSEMPDPTKQHAWRARLDGSLFVDQTVPEPQIPRDPRIEALEARLAKLEGKDATRNP